MNYGQVPDDVDVLAEDFCPMVASYGGRDRMASRAGPDRRAAGRTRCRTTSRSIPAPVTAS